MHAIFHTKVSSLKLNILFLSVIMKKCMFLFINQYPIIKVDYTEVQPYEDKDEILM